MISPFLVSTEMTAPSQSWRRTIGIPTRLFPTTDMLLLLGSLELVALQCFTVVYE